MAQPIVPFKYIPLKSGEIRLLYSKIQGDKSVWWLKAVQLHSQESEASVAFDALSYTWGDLSHTLPFICNDQELRIHQNLRDALSHIDKRQSSLPVWIDAICINQSDDKEKLAQVRLMHNIYRQATQVWVWLGCGIEHGKEAIGLLPQIGKVGKELGKEGSGEFAPQTRGLPNPSAPIWQAIKELIFNKWLNRLWVIQEAALAKRIRLLYGSDEIEWNIFEKAVCHGWTIFSKCPRLTQRPILEGPEANDTVFLVRERVQNRDPKDPWPYLLNIIRLTIDLSRCSEPCDRNFGILGLINQDQLQELGLQDNTSVDALYIRLTHFLLSNVSPTDRNWWCLLQYATAIDKRPGLPSWCPDYHSWSERSPHIRNIEEPVYLHGWTANSCISSARGTPQQSGNIREFKLRGKIFDSIRRAYSPIPYVAIFSEESMSLEEMESFCMELRNWERTIATDILGPASSILPDDPSSTVGLEARLVKATVDDYWRTLVSLIDEEERHKLTYGTFRSFRSALDRWLVLVQNRIRFSTVHYCLRSSQFLPKSANELLGSQEFLGGKVTYCSKKQETTHVKTSAQAHLSTHF